MQSEEMKTLLGRYKELEFEKIILEQTLVDHENEKVNQRLEKIEAQMKIFDTLLGVLNTDESFIIQNRLILKRKWNDVIILYEETFGRENVKSERTLKQIQANAIDKIIRYIMRTNTTQFICAMFKTG